MTITSASSATAARTQPIRWTLERAGAPLHLVTGHRLAITVQDDVSSSGAAICTRFRAMAQGVDH